MRIIEDRREEVRWRLEMAVEAYGDMRALRALDVPMASEASVREAWEEVERLLNAFEEESVLVDGYALATNRR